jgi:hypothetical protein
MATMTNATSLPETIANAIGKGKKRKDIVKTLCDSGIHPQAAEAMVEAAVKHYPSAVRSGALAQMGMGVVLFAIGLVITVGTYAAASSGGSGGFYLISWGPMVFGVVRVVRGLFRLVTA